MTRHLDNPDVCFVCCQAATGLGVEKGRSVGWLCQECADGHYGSRAIAMRASAFDEIQTRAINAAGAAGGGYLDRIGETDLAKLDPLNWEQFLQVVFEAYPAAIRAEIDKAVLRTPDEEDGEGEG